MGQEPKKYDLDLSRMEDEALVVLAQECAFRPASDVLILRHYQPMSKLIARKAKHRGLAADVQDAQQNGVFGILEAINGYNTLEAVKPRGCSFRSYVYMVVLARFQDFVKHVRRVERRYRSLERAEEGPANWLARCFASRRSDPADVVARQEETARLHRALARLDEPLRRLWQELSSGKKLPQIAREQSLSYDQVRRQRQRLLTHLAAEVRQ
jgi:RNA polymerase sigma factor (sigma-70 family)